MNQYIFYHLRKNIIGLHFKGHIWVSESKQLPDNYWHFEYLTKDNWEIIGEI